MSGTEHLSAPSLLKRLQLVGYKTFAARTDFEFQGGITAIVGPNGSGKSNVADAVRWVLGEQSFSLLRAKKGEDMIFSGSERKARLGMAEATLTLDNRDRWLDVDFAEVAITRRTYRSGDNEYLINGSKVRLRDITDLLGKSGLSKRTYTVIGQGLVDAALSLRPKERRTLIEEAAGLTLYQSRREDALVKLEATRANVLRVRDLIAEIGPRLRRLRRQAERAQEHALVRQELDEALRIWYSYQWQSGVSELGRVRSISDHQSRQLETQQKAVQALGTQIGALRARHSVLRSQLGQWHRESSALHARSEARQRELAVAEERRRLLVQSREEIASEIAPLQVSLDAQQEAILRREGALHELDQVLAEQEAEVSEAQAAVDARKRQAAEMAAARAHAQERVVSLRTQIAAHESRLERVDERRNEIQDDRQSHELAIQALMARLSEIQAAEDALTAQRQELERTAAELDVAQDALERQIAEQRSARQQLAEQCRLVERGLDRLQNHHDMLSRMRQEGAGLYDGVRNALRAARGRGRGGGRLEGIVGTVSELIEVPQELETAMEVALGGQLQALIVRSWDHAQAAISFLKETRGGRATFLPLDTLRPSRPVQVPQLPGVLGLASQLVGYAEDLAPVVTHLLGRTIVCRDLDVARRVLGAVRGGYQIVTPGGELARSSGSVTGGARNQRRQGGILARERELRELPERIREAEKQRDTLNRSAESAAGQEQELHHRLFALTEQLDNMMREQRAVDRQRDQRAQQREQTQRELDWHQSLLQGYGGELGELDRREREVREQLVGLGARLDAVQNELGDLQERLQGTEDRALESRLEEARSASGSTRQQRAAKQAELEGYRATRRELGRRMDGRKGRARELSAQLVETEKQIGALSEQQDTLSAEIGRYRERIEPSERVVQDLESQQLKAEQEEDRARDRLRDLEARHGRTQVELARQQDHMDNLRRRIKDELGLIDLDMGEELSGQPFLPLDELVSSLPTVTVLPEGLEEQVSALRRRLRRLEPVNPGAPAEYDEASERHAFLSAQAHDLEQASAHLREVIGELDEVMEREFKRSYQAISREFRRYFGELFGGGSARLELTDPDDLMNTGVDIVARPPGKRQQGLALLSGGERALTTAALLFGILTVSPTPFCVLDEMDAALDEANVGRFRAVLKALSEQTQFVVITHNRYTVEVADTIYGISMGADGVSSVLSHRFNASDSESA